MSNILTEEKNPKCKFPFSLYNIYAVKNELSMQFFISR